MRWPFVPRWVLDALLTEHRDQRREWASERARLIETIERMERSGFKASPAPPPSSWGAAVSPFSPAIRAAVSERVHPRFQGGTFNQVRVWQEEKVSEQEIIRRIQDGAEPPGAANGR